MMRALNTEFGHSLMVDASRERIFAGFDQSCDIRGMSFLSWKWL